MTQGPPLVPRHSAQQLCSLSAQRTTATPGMCTATLPTTAQASFLGSLLPLATESVTSSVTSVTQTWSLPLKERSDPEEGGWGPFMKPEAQACFFAGNFPCSGATHSGGEHKQHGNSG